MNESAARQLQQPERERVPFDPKALLGVLEAKDFPVAKESESLRAGFRTHDRFILSAATGSGKSTIAPLLFRCELPADAKMIVTQPRRIATKSLSDYVQTIAGKENVDYRYKGYQPNPNASIVYAVEGSLLKMLENDPMLQDTALVFFDEIDGGDPVLLARLKQAQELRRAAGVEQLKLVLASGTLDAPKLQNYFKGDGLGEMPVHHVEGRSHPVQELFAESEVPVEQVATEAAKKAAELLADTSKTGDMLIFMPGREEITQTIEALNDYFPDEEVDIITIVGGKDNTDPYAEINKPHTKRRIYVATNAAETSVTIDGITMVIDSGLERKNVYDPETRISSLQTLKHTKANYRQRWGRAGRTQPGESHALFTKADLDSREDHQIADIMHIDLSPMILRMKANGTDDVHNFDYIDKPDSKTIDNALAELTILGALDSDGKITQVGSEMADLELDNGDPHFARMLVEAKQRDCLEAVALLVGSMNTKSVFDYDRKSENFAAKYGQYIDPNSDFITYLNVWNDYIKNFDRKDEWAEQNGINLIALEIAARTRKNLVKGFDTAIDLTPEKIKAISMSVAAGLVDRVVVLSDRGYRFVDGRASHGITIDNASTLANKGVDVFMSAGVRRKGHGKTYMSMCQKIDDDMIAEFGYLREILNKDKEPEPAPEPEPVTVESEAEPVTPSVAEQQNRAQQNEAVAELHKIHHQVKENPTATEVKEIQTTFQRIKNTIKQLPAKIVELIKKLGRKLGLYS